MKFMIASDIHGDAYWCEQLVGKYQASGAMKLLLLGDILYHGPRNPVPEQYDPQKVAALLNPLKERIICVRGNCEAEVDQWLLEFPVMADYAQVLTEKRTFYLTHGHHQSMENLPPLAEGDVFCQGHTHVPVLTERSGITLVNPGSVSLPKNGSAHSYVIYDSAAGPDGKVQETLTLKDFDGNEIQSLSL
ncbi:hypothetical protein SAMN02745687_01422 [Lachnospiraceae bacterium NK3A20]|nr:hypothetical protein SAMN02745687_01422 [Lachnospiraceae bacterium NK3A20]